MDRQHKPASSHPREQGQEQRARPTLGNHVAIPPMTAIATAVGPPTNPHAIKDGLCPFPKPVPLRIPRSSQNLPYPGGRCPTPYPIQPLLFGFSYSRKEHQRWIPYQACPPTPDPTHTHHVHVPPSAGSQSWLITPSGGSSHRSQKDPRPHVLGARILYLCAVAALSFSVASRLSRAARTACALFTASASTALSSRLCSTLDGGLPRVAWRVEWFSQQSAESGESEHRSISQGKNHLHPRICTHLGAGSIGQRNNSTHTEMRFTHTTSFEIY